MTKMNTYLLAGGALAALLLLSGGSSSAQPAPQPQPGPAPNANLDLLRAQLNTLLAQANVAPDTVDPNAMDILAGQLQAAGLVQEAATLRAKAAEVRARQGRPA